MPSDRELLHLLQVMNTRRETSPTLQDLSARAGWSPFHLHRAFQRFVGETPKQYTLRLRLERAAARLASSDDSILAIALDAGFSSHEVFTRAFRRLFHQTPTQYRRVALNEGPVEARATHAALIETTGPCIGLFHLPTNAVPRRSVMPTLSIARQEHAEEPVLFVRSRVARHELATAIGEGLGKTFPYALKSGRAITGRPFTRYLSTGPGLYTIEVGMPLAAPAHGEGEIEAGVLPGGPVAVAVHAGPYDQLSETYAALERWIEANGYRVSDAPWESYITDPADHPDPADWRTEVYWPIGE